MSLVLSIGAALVGFIVLVCILVFAILAITGKHAKPSIVYRNVTQRSLDGEGNECVHLDCGHAFVLRRMSRSALPCPECGDAKFPARGMVEYHAEEEKR